jgi:hypothetical protein
MSELRTFRTREEVFAMLDSLPKMLAGETPAPSDLVRQMIQAIGKVSLSCIYTDFLIKSAGGTANGIKWPEPTAKSKAARSDVPHKKRGERPRGLLTEEQDKRWRSVYAGALRGLMRDGDDAKTAAAHASAYAWTVLKSEGAHTMLEVFGNRKVDIMIDSGALAESLRPGSGHPEQIIEVVNGAVSVGSRLPYAAIHQAGRFRLWPENELPPLWEAQIMQVISEWTERIIQAMMAGGSESVMPDHFVPAA